MSAYANDPRVRPRDTSGRPDHYMVIVGDQKRMICDMGVEGWLAGDAEGRIVDDRQPFADNADAVIQRLIGDPQ